MAKTRSPNRDKAYTIYKKHGGKITPKKIAELIGEKVVNIYSWKKNDEWDLKINPKGAGAPKGSKNATGNKGGGAPKGNINALKNGKYRKVIPKSEMALINDFIKKGANEVEVLQINIYIAQARLITLTSIPDEDIVKSKGKNLIEFITQHEQFIDRTKEFNRTLSNLTKLIKEYEALTGEKYYLDLKYKELQNAKLEAEVAKAGKGLDNELKIVVDYGDADGSS